MLFSKIHKRDDELLLSLFLVELHDDLPPSMMTVLSSLLLRSASGVL